MSDKISETRKVFLNSKGFELKSLNSLVAVNHENKQVACSLWTDCKNVIMSVNWEKGSKYCKKNDYKGAKEAMRLVLEEKFKLFIYFMAAKDVDAMPRTIKNFQQTLIERSLFYDGTDYYAKPLKTRR